MKVCKCKNKEYKKGGKTPAWTRKEGKNPKGGLNAKGVASYRKANPGSKFRARFRPYIEEEFRRRP